MAGLADWDSFYVIVGSAAGGLIGLQFVVMSLMAARPPTDASAGAAFATPTIVHFSVTLFISALTRVPWQSVEPLRVVSLLAGVGGIAYLVSVRRLMRQQSDYEPVFEDWMFHLFLPLAAYLTLFVTAAIIDRYTAAALMLLGGTALLLLLIGIHNAWDAVSYHVLYRLSRKEKSQ